MVLLPVEDILRIVVITLVMVETVVLVAVVGVPTEAQMEAQEAFITIHHIQEKAELDKTEQLVNLEKAQELYILAAVVEEMVIMELDEAVLAAVVLVPTIQELMDR